LVLSIRNLTLQEMVFPMEVAYKEGWNPGLYDGAAFYQADPEGFFIAELDGGMAGGVSVVRYGDGPAYIGNHFVLPPYRGRGIGKTLWEHALAQVPGRSVCINGLPDGTSFYESYGFESVCHIIRYRGNIFTEGRLSQSVHAAQDVDFLKLTAFDASCFGLARRRFLRTWLDTPAAESLCLLKEGEIRAWGCMRRCRSGWRLGPVFARDGENAEELLRHFAVKTIAEDVYMDITESNTLAIRLAFSMGMTPMEARVRMYKGERSDGPLDQIYGFTTVDIG